MSDPKHPVKIVVVVMAGMVTQCWADRPINARILVADYDCEGVDLDHPSLGFDQEGEIRCLTEEEITVDTPMVRNIINKKGGTIETT